MSDQTKLERLCNDGILYNMEFVERFGHSSPHWNNNNWFQREASLRHDMVCLLLCNTEPLYEWKDDNIADILEPPLKRQKLDDDSIPSCSTSSTKGSSTIGSDLTERDLNDMGDDERYRYILLEGRTNIINIQNRICINYGIQQLTRQYDIFDRDEGKFIEVKVTKDYNRSYNDYLMYFDDKTYTSFVHIHPETLDIRKIGKRDSLPGEAKAVSFLMKRLTELRLNYGIQDTELEYTEDLVKEVFSNARFNNMVEIWTQSFWSLRNLPLKELDQDPEFVNKIETIKEGELKRLIEDTTKRQADFIKFKAKLLPHVFTDSIITQEDEDSKMVDFLIGDCNFNDNEIMNWVVVNWRNKKDTFNFLKDSEFKDAPGQLLKDLGVNMKGTIRYDNHPDLKQPEFDSEPKLRYSAWVSNLLKESSEIDKFGLTYFTHLQEEEFPSIHPMGDLAKKVVDKIFQTFCETELSAYCSKIRNFYSRLGGAYLKRGSNSNKRPAVVIFPLYSSGEKDGVKTRRIYGFAIRGPQHAKKATDRIPFITMELMGSSLKSNLYQKFIKKPNFMVDSLGRKWCMRINSIMKQDPSYLTFVINSTYLTANMIGELTLSNTTVLKSPNCKEELLNFVSLHREWFLERMAESVYMAVMGNSQEEGTLAALRKIFMLKLNWSRGEKAHGSDTQGFADSLNECLGDQPLALYFAKQFRDILED